MTPTVHAVVGILQRANTYLLAERPINKPYSGFWEFPGGKIEANESGKEALTRELYEELGITVISAQPWFNHTHAYPDKTVLLEMWFISAFSGEPESKENQILRWTTLEEMSLLPLLEGNWTIIEKMKTLG